MQYLNLKSVGKSGDEADYQPLPPLYRAYGIPGTNLNGGTISGKEQNPRLTGRQWTLTAEDMLASDPIIRRSWALIKQTLLSAKWIFRAGIEGDPVSEELARFANEAFGFDGYSGMMDMTWEEQLGYLLEFIPMGWRYAEELYCCEPDSIGREKIFLKRFADREPTSHQRWLTADGVTLEGVMQNMVGGVQPEPIPAGKAERSGFTQGEITAMIQEAEAQARDYIAQEQGYLIENTAIKFDSFGSQGQFNPDGALKVIQECDNQVSQAFFAQFMNLGISDTGSRSVGEVHLSVFRRACINYLDLVASAISGQDRRGGGTIGRLINWNYGRIEATKLPKLTHMGLDNDELTDALNSLPALVQSQLLTPDDNLERAIRQRIGAGDLPTDATRTSQDRAIAQNPSLAMAERLRGLK